MENLPPLGICICGLNGSGKTTLARALAQALHLYPIDIEDCYFTDSDIPYSSPCSYEEAKQRLQERIQAHPRFVFSAVNGNIGEEIPIDYQLVIYLHAPQEIRMTRIQHRAYSQFGARVLPGGDMYEQEQAFFHTAAQKSSAPIEQWLRTLTCPVLYLDGTASLDDHLTQIFSATFP